MKQNIGIIAMKIFAADGLAGQPAAEKLLYYSLSLPVTLAVVGMPKLELIEENVRLVKSFRPMAKDEMQTPSQALSNKDKFALDRYFQNHIDA